MKKSILFAITLFYISISAFAQIPNNSFENWTSMGSYSNPDNWDNLNSMTSSMSVYTCTKGTGGASGGGSSYLKLTSKNVSGMGIMPGVAVCGTIDMMSFKPVKGFAFTGRPQQLTGSWQYMPSGNDIGFVSVCLTKWNSGMMMRDTIAWATQNITSMMMSWTAFNITLNYMSSATPDSAMIIFSASGSTPVANTYLYVDNISFTGTVTGIENMEPVIANTVVYPNPATDNISVKMNLQKTSTAKLQLVDMIGRVVVEEYVTNITQNEHTSTINTTNIAKGTYFLKVIANDAIETKKIIIE